MPSRVVQARAAPPASGSRPAGPVPLHVQRASIACRAADAKPRLLLPRRIAGAPFLPGRSPPRGDNGAFRPRFARNDPRLGAIAAGSVRCWRALGVRTAGGVTGPWSSGVPSADPALLRMGLVMGAGLSPVQPFVFVSRLPQVRHTAVAQGAEPGAEDWKLASRSSTGASRSATPRMMPAQSNGPVRRRPRRIRRSTVTADLLGSYFFFERRHRTDPTGCLARLRPLPAAAIAYPPGITRISRHASFCLGCSRRLCPTTPPPFRETPLGGIPPDGRTGSAAPQTSVMKCAGTGVTLPWSTCGRDFRPPCLVPRVVFVRTRNCRDCPWASGSAAAMGRDRSVWWSRACPRTAVLTHYTSLLARGPAAAKRRLYR